MARPNLALVGFMGTGKTAVGRLLAERLGLAYLDLDEEIARRAGRGIPEIFASDGEEEFRRLERECIEAACRRSDRVLSCGGGAVLDPRNLRRLRASGLVVCLWADPEILWKRLRNDRSRPLLAGENPRGALEKLLAEREPVYRSIEPFVDTSSLSTGEVADRIERLYRERFECTG